MISYVVMMIFCLCVQETSCLVCTMFNVMWNSWMPRSSSQIYRFNPKQKMYITKTAYWMLIVVLFTVMKTWKQPTCPSVHE